MPTVTDGVPSQEGPSGASPASRPPHLWERIPLAQWAAVAAVAATVVALIPVMAAIISRISGGDLPGGDVALIDLRVRDVFAGDTPLVGPYSRYGWSHPGPAMFYAIAPLNALAGGASWATFVGAAALQGLAIGLSARLAWRRGGLLLVLLVLAAITAAYLGEDGGHQFVEAWNPHVAFPFFTLFVLQIWSVGIGNRWQLLGAAVVGTFLVQTHASYAALVVAGAAWAIVAVVRDRARLPLREWRQVAAISAAVAGVLWIPPIVEQLTADDGNLSLIVRYATGTRDRAGLATAAELFAAEFKPWPAWLGGEAISDPASRLANQASALWLVVPVALLLLGYRAARRARARDAQRLMTLVALLSGVTLLGLSQIDSPLHPYLFYWRTAITTLAVAAVIWALINGMRGSDGRPLVVVGVVLAVGIGATAWSLTADVRNHAAAYPGVNQHVCEESTRALVRQLRDRGLPHHPVLLRSGGGELNGGFGGTVDELDRLGVPVRVDEEISFAYGEERGASAEEFDTVWIVTHEGNNVSILTDKAGARVIARTTPLSRPEESELVELQRQLTVQLRGFGRDELVPLLGTILAGLGLAEVPGIDHADAERVATLNGRVEHSDLCRAAVIEFATDDAPPIPLGTPTR